MKQINMLLALALNLVVSGCTTSVVSGHRKILGIKIPFTGNPEAVADPKMAAMIEQLAPLVYVAIPLIIAGAYWWWVTKGNTGLGKIAMGLGVGFIVAAVVIPLYAGWIGLMALAAIIGLFAYKFWAAVIKKKELGNDNAIDD